MRDPVLEEALKRLAAEASTRFSSLVATGDQIPFDVAENDGDSAHFYRYVPLTSRYIASHLDELRSLPSWGPARGAVAAAGVAAPYLEARGLPVTSEPNRRAEEMLDVFIASLWEGTTEFSLDIARVEAALNTLEVESRDIGEADLLLVPLAGFEMTPTEIELPGGIRIVAADSVDAPLEATSSEGTERAAWDETYLALAPMGEPGPARALATLNSLIEALRLFKQGSVGIGPYAFAPVGDGAWRRLETDAVPPRPGSYFLIESEVEGLARLMRRLGKATRESSRHQFARKRFRYGSERSDPVEALPDHLLAIRSALQGEGVIDAPLEARAAALVTGDADDLVARDRFRRAFQLEESLIRGEDVTDVDGESSSYVAAWIEDSTRLIVREALLGSFGENLNVTAEETLITTGLAAGEGSPEQLGSTTEWDIFTDEDPADELYEELEEAVPGGAEIHLLRPPTEAGFTPDTGPDSPAERADSLVDPLFGPVPELAPEPVPDRFESMPEIERALGIRNDGETAGDAAEDSGVTRLMEPVPADGEITVRAQTEVGSTLREDWLESSRSDATLDFPALGSEVANWPESDSQPARNRKLFPDPEPTQWTVRELEYRRR